MLWLVPGLALTKSKINSGELTDKYLEFFTAGRTGQSAGSDLNYLGGRSMSAARCLAGYKLSV